MRLALAVTTLTIMLAAAPAATQPAESPPKSAAALRAESLAGAFDACARWIRVLKPGAERTDAAEPFATGHDGAWVVSFPMREPGMLWGWNEFTVQCEVHHDTIVTRHWIRG